MKIDVRAISKDPGALMELDISPEPKEIGLESEGFVFFHPVKFEGAVKNISKGVLQLAGNIQTDVKSNCDRCLCETEFEVDTRLDVIFKSSLMQSRNLEFDSDETPEYDDEDEYKYQGYELVPDKALRDAILLAMPVKVLCKEDCKGFCTNCRTNMNETNCKCGDNRETRTNRFEELRKLL